jgi:transforming growth factor-beta-induced protein
LLASIVDIACETENLSVLCELILGSDNTTDALTDDLFTVFAPTDDAFASIDAELFNELVNCTAAMNSVVAFHTVAESEIFSTDLVCGGAIEMSNGDDSRTVCRNGYIYQKGSLNPTDDMPMVVTADIEACNGVIHIVDKVMIPKANRIAVCDDDSDDDVAPPAVPAPSAPSACKTVAQIICEDSSFSLICDLVMEFDWYEALSTGTWTIFAPPDNAFTAIEEVSEDFTNCEIGDVLSFHAVFGQTLMFDDLLCAEKITMANSDDSRTQCELDKVTREVIKYQKGVGQMDGMLPQITDADIMACNGVVHVVNNVMIPKL